MPIRLNLLAEAQAIEEMRHRDPAKRVLWAAALLITLMLVWAGSLQVKAMRVNKDLGPVVTQMNSRTNQYQQVLENQKKAAAIEMKLGRLNQLATNRFLSGALLNALQQTTIDDVQLVHLKVEQTYTLTEPPKETKPNTNTSRTLPSKPATVKEEIVVTLEGKDSSSTGDQYNKFKEALASHPYFQNALGKTNEVTLKSFIPAAASLAPGKNFVQFTLEGRLMEKTR